MSRKGLIIDRLGRGDLDRIYGIERSVYEDPWTRPLFEQSLEAPMTYSIGVFRSKICIAYAIYQVVFTEAHILNLAVAPGEQRNGVANFLLDYILEDVRKKEALSIYLEVRPSNKAALGLYRKRGFRAIMVRDKYYSDGEHAFIMMTELKMDVKKDRQSG